MSVLPDYQDFMPPRQQAGKLIVADNNLHMLADRVYGLFYVGDWKSVSWRLTIDYGTDLYRINFQWYSDAAATIQVGTHDSYTDGTIISDSIPCMSNYLRITITRFNPADTPFFTFFVQLRSEYDRNARNMGDGAIIIGTGTPLGAGVTANLLPARVLGGPAMWHVTSTAPLWSTTLMQLGAGLAVERIARMDSGGGGEPSRTMMVTLPPRPVLLQITNTAGGAVTMFATLITQWSA